MSNTENYPNRSDLRNPANKVAKMAATGQTYGKATEQIRAQEAVPMGSGPNAELPEPAPIPGQFGPLDRTSERPAEPITAGMSFGEGPGPEMLAATPNMAPGSKDDLIMQLRAAAAKYPNPNLIQLLVMLESQ